MKVIMVMFDTLNRRLLSPYGCDWTHTPNFQRLADKTVMFDNCYVGSMPCMPARRELHTGRYNFLHRGWGPLEPYDDSLPEILQRHGVYTHMVTDHPHYWEDGGATYHTRYNSFELIRGQEGDPWKGEVQDPVMPESVIDPHIKLRRQDWVNRKYIRQEEDFPQAQTFAKGLEFIRTNSKEDRWFLQLETFDPHEPFFAPQKYRDHYSHEYNGKHFDWPAYKQADESEEEIQHCRYEYASLLSACDANLARVLDLMDELDLWKDTMLIVNTDHGFLLGEHDWWAKCVQPFYDEVANIPLFIWDPRVGKKGEHRESLVQMIDFAPTILDFFGAEIPRNMQGKPLRNTLDHDQSVREAALFGIHGGHVNCTDGLHVYMRAPAQPENTPLYNYTLMPTHMRGMFSLGELRTLELSSPFSFTKGLKLMKINANPSASYHKFGNLLFDLKQDPAQQHNINNEKIEQNMLRHMVRLMKETDAPKEQYERLGLEKEAERYAESQ